MNEVFSMNVKIYPELLKYKNDFGNAIKIYHDLVMVDEDYSNYISQNEKVSCRLKCEYQSTYYKKLLETVKLNIKEGGNTQTISDSTLINNVLASLINISWFN